MWFTSKTPEKTMLHQDYIIVKSSKVNGAQSQTDITISHHGISQTVLYVVYIIDRKVVYIILNNVETVLDHQDIIFYGHDI